MLKKQSFQAFSETLVVEEMIKNRFNSTKGNNLFYFRDNIITGLKAQSVLEYGGDQDFKTEAVQITSLEILNTDLE